MSDCLSAALAYAARGWPVLPLWWPTPDGLCTCGDKECRSPAKHPVGPLAVNGLHSATTDAEIIRRWWSQYPRANVGVVTGLAAGIVVLDVDGEIGLGSMRVMPMMPTPQSRTGRGYHLVLAHPGQLVKNLVHVRPGLDLRGDGGYFVAPPSRHASGSEYEWIISPDDEPPAPCPEWLLDTLHTKEKGPAPVLGERIPEGQRDASLTSLAGTLRRRGADEIDILNTLRDWNDRHCDPPLPDKDLQRIAHSIAQKPVGDPLVGFLPLQCSLSDAELNGLTRTDAGNAEAMARMFSDRLRYDHTRKRWLCYDGVRWRTDTDGEAERLCVSLAEYRYRAAWSAPEKEQKELVRWSMTSRNHTRVQATLAMASKTRPLPSQAKEFDQDPWLLGCEDEIVDLRTGETVTEQQPRVTLSTGILYKPEAACPRWCRFLQEVFAGHPELIPFLQQAIGYTLTGDTREQVLFLCWGKGSNGKTVFLNTLRYILGEYAHNTAFSTFLDNDRDRAGAATPELANLYGARLVTASEVKEERYLNEARIKSLTGGDPITARPLYGNLFTFLPTFKIWLAVNHRPIIRETGVAIWRRLVPIPFEVSFTADKADPDLEKKLKDEGPGILSWAMEGCRDWLTHGRLVLPETVQIAREEYQADQDLLGRFIQECCITSPTAQVGAKQLYAAYRAWCEANGEKPWTSNAFGRKMNERYDRYRESGQRMYLGLALAPRESGGNWLSDPGESSLNLKDHL